MPDTETLDALIRQHCDDSGLAQALMRLREHEDRVHREEEEARRFLRIALPSIAAGAMGVVIGGVTNWALLDGGHRAVDNLGVGLCLALGFFTAWAASHHAPGRRTHQGVAKN